MRHVLSYFVKCTEHDITSMESTRESCAKWLSVASRPELISTIKKIFGGVVLMPTAANLL